MHLAARFGLVVATLALGVSVSASAASPVVPPAGAAAGEGYSYWLALKDRTFFDTGGSPPTCQTVHTSTATGLFLDGSQGHSVSCNAAAGEGIYVDGPSNECSTVKGDHSGFGSSAAQLVACAKAGYASAKVSGAATVDGTPVADYAALVVGTPALAVQIPAHNGFGVKGGAAMTADYGEGLLLTGLASGTHTIVVHVKIGKMTNVVHYTLHVA
jgi:hypothetical protein